MSKPKNSGWDVLLKDFAAQTQIMRPGPLNRVAKIDILWSMNVVKASDVIVSLGETKK